MLSMLAIDFELGMNKRGTPSLRPDNFTGCPLQAHSVSSKAVWRWVQFNGV